MEAEVYGISKVKVITTKAGTLEVLRGSTVVATQTITSAGTYNVRVPGIPSVSPVQYTARVKSGTSVQESATFYMGFGDTKEVCLDTNAINSDYIIVGDGLVKDGKKIKHTARAAKTVGSSTQIPVITTDATGHVTSLSTASIGVTTTSTITNSTALPTASAVKNYVDGKIYDYMPSSTSSTTLLSTSGIKNYVGGMMSVLDFGISQLTWKVSDAGRVFTGTGDFASTTYSGFDGYNILGIVGIDHTDVEATVGKMYYYYDTKRLRHNIKIVLCHPDASHFATAGSMSGTLKLLRMKY